MPTKKELKKTSSGKVILNIKLKKGGLSGYKINDPLKTKRKVLDILVIEYGYSTIVKRLNILAIYNKNKNPLYSSIIRKDIEYLQNKYRNKNKKSVKSPKLRKSPKSKTTKKSKTSAKAKKETKKDCLRKNKQWVKSVKNKSIKRKSYCRKKK